MTYFEEIEEAMTALARNPDARFVGYGLLAARTARGLTGVPVEQIVETPTAENLMLGVAIGLALRGLAPVVIFERMDFLLNAADCLVNHLDKIGEISKREFLPKVLIRCIVGNRKSPLFTGATHIQDLSPGFDALLHWLPVYQLGTDNVRDCFMAASGGGLSSLLVEYKDLYPCPTTSIRT